MKTLIKDSIEALRKSYRKYNESFIVNVLSPVNGNKQLQFSSYDDAEEVFIEEFNNKDNLTVGFVYTIDNFSLNDGYPKSNRLPIKYSMVG